MIRVKALNGVDCDKIAQAVILPRVHTQHAHRVWHALSTLALCLTLFCRCFSGFFFFCFCDCSFVLVSMCTCISVHDYIWLSKDETTSRKMMKITKNRICSTTAMRAYWGVRCYCCYQRAWLTELCVCVCVCVFFFVVVVQRTLVLLCTRLPVFYFSFPLYG